jgi:quercetin dioxygenase-like cupin family protein
MKRVLMGVLVAAFVCLAGSVAAEDAKAPAKAPAKKAAAPAYKSWGASEMKFADMEGAKGVSAAALWGDSKKGEYGSIIKFAAGTDMGWHTHTNRVRLVMVSGTLVIEVKGQPAKELGPGAFAEESGKVVHHTSCKAGADCVFFVHQHGKFDVVPVEEKK